MVPISSKQTKTHSSVKRRGEEAHGVDDVLFGKLSSERKRIAEQLHCPAFVIFSNGTLREMVNLRPHTMEEMRRVPGVGDNKLLRYGKAFLQVIADDEAMRR